MIELVDVVVSRFGLELARLRCWPGAPVDWRQLQRDAIDYALGTSPSAYPWDDEFGIAPEEHAADAHLPAHLDWQAVPT